MAEATGMEAKTIHRLLEYKPPEGYQKNEDKPLEGDVLILDENVPWWTSCLCTTC